MEDRRLSLEQAHLQPQTVRSFILLLLHVDQQYSESTLCVWVCVCVCLVCAIVSHFDGVHSRDHSEDHVAHLIWNFMAIYHVLVMRPDLNDLPSFEDIRRAHGTSDSSNSDSEDLLVAAGAAAAKSFVDVLTRISKP